MKLSRIISDALAVRKLVRSADRLYERIQKHGRSHAAGKAARQAVKAGTPLTAGQRAYVVEGFKIEAEGLRFVKKVRAI